MSAGCNWRCQCEKCVSALSDKAERARGALVARVESSLNDRNHPRRFTHGAAPFAVEAIESFGGATIDYPRHLRQQRGVREIPQVNQRYRVTGTVNGEASVYEITVGEVRGQFVGMKHAHVGGAR